MCYLEAPPDSQHRCRSCVVNSYAYSLRRVFVNEQIHCLEPSDMLSASIREACAKILRGLTSGLQRIEWQSSPAFASFIHPGEESCRCDVSGSAHFLTNGPLRSAMLSWSPPHCLSPIGGISGDTWSSCHLAPAGPNMGCIALYQLQTRMVMNW